MFLSRVYLIDIIMFVLHWRYQNLGAGFSKSDSVLSPNKNLATLVNNLHME